MSQHSTKSTGTNGQDDSTSLRANSEPAQRPIEAELLDTAAEQPSANDIQFIENAGTANDGEPAELIEAAPVTESAVVAAEPVTDIQEETVAAGHVATEPVLAEYVKEPRSWPFRLVRGFGRVVEWPFGVACLIVGLAVLAAIPVMQFLSLGYLLEVSGRVARTGRLRDGFVGVRKAARAGSVVMGAWLCFLPVQLLSSIWYKANLIAADSNVTAGWRVAQIVVTILAVAHIVAACYCGGRLRHFFWPLLAPFSLGMWLARLIVSNRSFRPVIENTVGHVAPRLVQDICNWQPLSDWFLPAVLVKGVVRGTLYRSARDGLWDFVTGLRLPHYFWLGLRGFVGAAAWLLIPALLLVGGMVLPGGKGGGVCLLLGVPLTIVVVMYLPFLQTHFAAENRLGAYLELGRIRRSFRHAPIAFLLAFVITIVFALPPYLFKIAPLSNLGATQNELTWITCLVFITFIFPTKLLTGWAVGRGQRRQRPAHWTLRWSIRPVMLVVPLAYFMVLFFAQYVSWHGTWSLFEQHIFLVPAPFFSVMS